jgi:cytochrome P450
MSLLLTLGLLFLAICFYISFRNVFQPGWVSRRNLPKPKQGFWLFRLLHEPRESELEEWADTIEHNGLIRYFGVLNEERLLAASPESVKELMTANTYDYVKPKFQNEAVTHFACKGLVILEGAEHKAARRQIQPAFRRERIHAVYSAASASATTLARKTFGRRLLMVRSISHDLSTP